MADNTTPNHIELLYEAALKGNVPLLQDLLQRDTLLLHRPLPPSQATPLHVACNLGHTNVVQVLLDHNPSRIEELDPTDKSSLLHLAARNRHLELVNYLVSINPGLCYVRDIHGRNPAHVAAMKGQLDVLTELLTSTPDVARERAGLDKSGGDTIMHLCVRFNQLDALKLTVKMVGDALMDATDVDGNTILHLAVANKHLGIVDFLLSDDGRVKKNTKNSNGLTAMDLLTKSSSNSNEDALLRSTLKQKKVLPSKAVDKKEKKKQSRSAWFEKPEKERKTFMIVATLIATMAFQAGLNPPGGVWQDTTPLTDQSNAPAPSPTTLLLSEADPDNTLFLSELDPDKEPHIAGSSIMAQRHRIIYPIFFISTMLGFMLAMVVILLLISGFPSRRFSMFFIKSTLWIAISATAFSYLLSAWALIPVNHFNLKEFDAMAISIVVWFVVMGLVLIGHIVVYTGRFTKYICKCFIQANHRTIRRSY